MTMMTLGFQRNRALAALSGTGLALCASNALAAEPSPDASRPSSAQPPAAADSGAVLLAGKFGGIASFNGLSPFPTVGIEAGYLFPGTNGRIAAALAAEYTAPSSDGSQTETFSPERLPAGGSYTWELRQKDKVTAVAGCNVAQGLSDTIVCKVPVKGTYYIHQRASDNLGSVREKYNAISIKQTF